jgi:[FeFe] hydrogenase (group B1/B3)
MRKYESQVQNIRYKVIHEIAKTVINQEFNQIRYKLPKMIIQGDTPSYRCCVYKEREIISERINLAVDEIGEKNQIIEIIDIACDECPTERYIITEACRGCMAHKCIQACPKDAIRLVHGKAMIDPTICVSCGKCKEACPYNAISDVLRPCKKACASKAIEIGKDQLVSINRDKCTNCGACVYNCPFGAVTDRSEIVPIIEALEQAKVNPNQPVYAVIAPSIASQYNEKIGKIVHAIKQMGFRDVIEAALGADLVAYYETEEFIERVIEGGEACLMTSCCPSFVEHLKRNQPHFAPYLSTMVSPMIAVSRLIKKIDSHATVVFIGPCTSKKREKNQEDLRDATDYVLTFEELDAIIDAYGINISQCEDTKLDNASQFGRLFARSGGVKAAITQVLKEKGMEDAEFRPIACNGIEEVDRALRLLKAGRNAFNFMEGMACVGGCIGGAVCLTHKDNKKVDEYASLAKERHIKDALRIFEDYQLNLHRQA